MNTPTIDELANIARLLTSRELLTALLRTRRAWRKKGYCSAQLDTLCKQLAGERYN